MNLGEIRTLMSSVLNRTDMTDADANQWITMALRRIQRWVKIPSQEVSLATTIGATFTGISVPSDYLSTKAVYLDAIGGGPLEMISDQEYFAKRAIENYTGIPKYYTRVGSKFQLYPSPTEDQVITLIYWAEHGDMLIDTDENILARVAPDMVCYTALIYAGNFYIDERTPQWKEMAGEFAIEIETQAEEAEASGGNMRIKPMYGSGEY